MCAAVDSFAGAMTRWGGGTGRKRRWKDIAAHASDRDPVQILDPGAPGLPPVGWRAMPTLWPESLTHETEVVCSRDNGPSTLIGNHHSTKMKSRKSPVGQKNHAQKEPALVFPLKGRWGCFCVSRCKQGIWGGVIGCGQMSSPWPPFCKGGQIFGEMSQAEPMLL